MMIASCTSVVRRSFALIQLLQVAALLRKTTSHHRSTGNFKHHACAAKVHVMTVQLDHPETGPQTTPSVKLCAYFANSVAGSHC
jgi:hypothetical protein